MDRIHVIVIPNKDKGNISPFYKTSTMVNHEDLLRDFYNSNGFKIPDDQNFYVDLIAKGAIVILTFAKKAVAFIPSLVSEEQFQALKSYENFIKTFEELDLGIFNDDLKELSYNLNDNPEAIEQFFKIIGENVVGSQVRMS